MSIYSLSLGAILLPLISAFLVGVNTSRIRPKTAHIISISFVIASAVASWILFFYVSSNNSPIHLKLFNWFKSGKLVADWSIYIDQLTAVMLVVVNTVSSLVHIYSIGYMSHDNSQQRFMSYLSLFTFFMLFLVSADNFAQLFVGWEGVGLSSYLLIGFWFHKKSAYTAAMKAFLVNRVGDIGLLIGIFLIAMNFGSLEYNDVFSQAHEASGIKIDFLGSNFDLMNAICIFLFIGCMGKSAQLGLHVWLPDAMEGPTPVSALIHAATMVTAGVFLLARCSYLFEYSEVALNLITIVGAVTCLFAATVALVQTDIKRIIAYSTCSQLGYMFFACGVSAYYAGIFHLVTHAFFKALLFLSAGSIIHALNDEQDITKMGGIWQKLPYTHALMWVGSIAIAGIPPLSGFFSKDLILESAYSSSSSAFGKLAYWIGLSSAVLTAFYSCRLLFLVFYGQTHLSTKTFNKIHEAPKSMMIPLLVLGIGSLVVGYLGHHLLAISESKFWNDSIFVMPENDSLANIEFIQHWVARLPLFASMLGIFVAYLMYMIKPSLTALLRKKFCVIFKILQNKWYFDEIYNLLFIKSVKGLALFCAHFFDSKVIDGVPNGITKITGRIAKVTSLLQTGLVYHYALAMLIGIMILVYWYLPW